MALIEKQIIFGAYEVVYRNLLKNVLKKGAFLFNYEERYAASAFRDSLSKFSKSYFRTNYELNAR